MPPLFEICTLFLLLREFQYILLNHTSPLCRVMDKKEKKRKRSEDAHAESTAKRVAVESSAKTINVSIAPNDGEWGPILGK